MKTKQAFSSLLATGSLVCVMLLSACGNASSSSVATTAATATTATSTDATSTPAATGATLSQDYASTDGVISMKYPAGWTSQALNVAEAPNSTMFSSADLKDILVLEPLTTQVTTDTYITLGNAFLQGIKATNVQMGTNTQPATIGSITWTGVQGTATFNGIDSTLTELGTDHNGVTLLVFTLGPTATDSSDGNTYFQPMVTSLMFMK